MSLRIVDEIDFDAMKDPKLVQAEIYDDKASVFIVREDYYYANGYCYSGIMLTRSELEELLAKLT